MFFFKDLFRWLTVAIFLYPLLRQLHECNNANLSIFLLDDHLSFLLGVFAVRNYINKNIHVYNLVDISKNLCSVYI